MFRVLYICLFCGIWYEGKSIVIVIICFLNEASCAISLSNDSGNREGVGVEICMCFCCSLISAEQFLVEVLN